MVKLRSFENKAWLSAIERAYAQRKAGNVTKWIGPMLYEVHSAHENKTYITKIFNIGKYEAVCSCPYGQHHEYSVCWHAVQAICEEIRRVRFKGPKREVPAIHHDTVGARG